MRCGRQWETASDFICIHPPENPHLRHERVRWRWVLSLERSGSERVGRRNEEWALWQINKKKKTRRHSIIIFLPSRWDAFRFFIRRHPSSKVEEEQFYERWGEREATFLWNNKTTALKLFRFGSASVKSLRSPFCMYCECTHWARNNDIV